jgi:hypothetical protein
MVDYPDYSDYLKAKAEGKIKEEKPAKDETKKDKKDK